MRAVYNQAALLNPVIDFGYNFNQKTGYHGQALIETYMGIVSVWA